MTQPTHPSPVAPADLGFEKVVYEKTPPRATITLNRPEVLNAFELQMACDLAVMADDAFIRHVGLEHGSVPAGGATQWLPIMVGDRRAREIVMLCEEIPAAKAAECGLVNRAVPAAELDAAVEEYAGKLATKLPQTTRYAKQHLNWWRDVSWHETIGHARDWLALSMLGDEAKEAIEKFLAR